MDLHWKYSGRAVHSRRRRYTVNVPDNPAGTFATDSVSTYREEVDTVFQESAQAARAKVMGYSRVDTGYMRANVEAFTATPRESVSMEFGWDEGRPHYAPYQEFGTRKGIQPMMAVHRAFHETLADLQKKLG